MNAIAFLEKMYRDSSDCVIMIDSCGKLVWRNNAAKSHYSVLCNSDSFIVLLGKENLDELFFKENFSVHPCGAINNTVFSGSHIPNTDRWLVHIFEAEQENLDALYENYITNFRRIISNIYALIPALTDIFRENENDSYMKLLVSVAKSCVQLMQLTNHISNYTRITKKNFALYTATLDANQFIRKTAETICKNVSKDVLQLDIVPAASSALFSADYSLLSGLAAQLVASLMDFSKNPPIQIQIATTVDEEEKMISFCFSGQGIAMDEEIAKNIFSPNAMDVFYEQKNRLGLGLTISYLVASLHNGNLTYENRDGKNIFVFTVPLAEDLDTFSLFSSDASYDNNIFSPIHLELADYISYDF